MYEREEGRGVCEREKGTQTRNLGSKIWLECSIPPPCYVEPMESHRSWELETQRELVRETERSWYGKRYWDPAKRYLGGILIIPVDGALE